MDDCTIDESYQFVSEATTDAILFKLNTATRKEALPIFFLTCLGSGPLSRNPVDAAAAAGEEMLLALDVNAVSKDRLKQIEL
jgi:hypothetical protein